jgi:hypothetical protein
LKGEAPPAGSYIDDFKALWRRKNQPRRGILRRLHRRVSLRYFEFYILRERLETLPARSWPEKASEALRHCYEGRGAELARLKTGLLDGLSTTGRMRCPYCLLRQPGTIDHFLPLERFPEFAVLVLNWVWACGTCNQRKGTGMVSVPRSVLTPYFDGISDDVPLLYAQVIIADAIPTVTFTVPAPNPLHARPALPAIAQRQFAGFEIADGLRRDAAAFLRSTIGIMVADARELLTQADLTRLLRARRANFDQFGINGWEQTLIEALETCPALLGHVNELIAAGPPPPPLREPRSLDLVTMAAAVAGKA